MIFLIIQLNFVWNDLIDFDIDKKIDIENSKLSNVLFIIQISYDLMRKLLKILKLYLTLMTFIMVVFF